MLTSKDKQWQLNPDNLTNIKVDIGMVKVVSAYHIEMERPLTGPELEAFNLYYRDFVEDIALTLSWEQ